MIETVGDHVMTFAEWLYARRTGLGWSQVELATRAGISSQIISHIEKGIRQPGKQVLRGLALAFGMSVDDILSHLDQPHTTLEQLRAEGVPADVLAELEHYAPDLLPDDWEMMVEVVRRTARKNAARSPERKQRAVPPAQPDRESGAGENGSHPRKSARMGRRAVV